MDQALCGIGAGATYRRLIRRWLENLAALGMLRQANGCYVADQPLPDPGLAALWAEAERLFGTTGRSWLTCGIAAPFLALFFMAKEPARDAVSGGLVRSR